MADSVHTSGSGHTVDSDHTSGSGHTDDSDRTAVSDNSCSSVRQLHYPVQPDCYTGT